MYLGNIVSETPIRENKLFNITNSLTNIDREIPTLIIGWDFSKRIFSGGTKLSILDKKIDKNTNWTFTKKEKRVDFEKDMSFFMKDTIKSIETRVKYQYINVLTASYSEIKKIVKKLSSQDVNYIYINKNSFVYAYLGDVIIGLDLNFIDFLSIDRKKIYRLLYSNKNEVFFNDDFLSIEVRENIDNNQKIIPYLFAIENDRKQN